MTGRAGLVADLLKFLSIHGPISRRWHLDEMAEKPRYVKGGKPRLGDGVCFEFCNLLSRPLVTKLLRYPRTIRTFRFFKCVFA